MTRLSKPYLIFLLAFSCFTGNVSSQNYFNKTYVGPNKFTSVIVVNNGYIAIGDTLISGNNQKCSLVKINLVGDTIWRKTFGISPYKHISNKIINTSYGFALTSSMIDTLNPTDTDILLATFDYNGNYLWHQIYGGLNTDIPSDIMITADSGFIISGYTNSIGAGNNDFYLIKTDSLGNTEWERTYGNQDDDVCISMATTADSGFILCGYSNSLTPDYDIRVIKTDNTGNVIWDKSYSLSGDDKGGKISLCHDEYFLVGTNRARLFKIDPFGDSIWSKYYTFPNFTGIREIRTVPIENPDGTFFMGASNDFSGFYIQVGLTIDPMGNLIRMRDYSLHAPNLEHWFNDLIATSDSGYIFCGSARNLSNKKISWIVKTDCFGCDTANCSSTGINCFDYDCSLYPIDAFFASSVDTLDLAYGNSVFFDNASLNTSARKWNFGDGNSGYTTDTISHSFTQTGTFTVSLIVYHGMCTDTFSREIVVINTVGVNEITNDNYFMNIYPNPSNGFITIEFETTSQNSQIEIHDLTGKLVKIIPINSSKRKFIFDNSDLSSGTYFCFLTVQGNKIKRLKMLVMK